MVRALVLPVALPLPIGPPIYCGAHARVQPKIFTQVARGG